MFHETLNPGTLLQGVVPVIPFAELRDPVKSEGATGVDAANPAVRQHAIANKLVHIILLIIINLANLNKTHIVY